MAETFEVLLFGDETGDFREPLERLCERRRGILFLHFIEKLNETLRDEIRQQPRHVQEQIPPFTDIQDLVRRYHAAGSRNQILETTLACVCQLASVIRSVSPHFKVNSRQIITDTPRIAILMTIHHNILCLQILYS